jgi:hypothetical protein
LAVLGLAVVMNRPVTAPSLRRVRPSEAPVAQAPVVREQQDALSQEEASNTFAPVASAAAAAGSKPAAATAAPARAAPATERPASGAAASAPDRSSPSSTSATLKVSLEVSQQMLTPGAGTMLTLVACNTTDDLIDESFGSAQRYDFEAVRRGDRMWRWSDGKAFAQVFGDEHWSARECRRFSEKWTGADAAGRPLPPGRYDVFGWLTGTKPLRTEPRSVCIATCD